MTKEITIDDLAAMVQNGFTEIKTEMNGIRNEVGEIRTEMGELRAELKEVKQDTEDIKADLNKKVDKIEYKTLEYRMERLEEKAA